MASKNRRECGLYAKSEVLSAFEQSNARIIHKYETSSDAITQQGMRLLQRITQEYLRGKDLSAGSNHGFEVPITKKSLIEDQEHRMEKADFKEDRTTQESSKKEREKVVQFEDLCKTEKKTKEQFNEGSSFKPKRMSEGEQLQESLKKMGLDENYEVDDEGDNTKLLEECEQLKNKSIHDLIKESNAKMKESMKNMPEENHSDSSYVITDYSSNESSNDNEYKEAFLTESNSKEFSKAGSQSILGSQSFGSSMSMKPMKLMHSPKKSKSQKKRLFVHNKKVPRWAEDLTKINETVFKQSQDPNFDPILIYGTCLVERLDSNVIFGINEKYCRGSSAKWTDAHRMQNPYKFAD